MVRLSPAPAVGVVVAADSDRVAAVPWLTVTERPVPLLMVPSVTVMFTVSTLYRVITPLLDPDTVAWPPMKVMAVVEPKLVAVPEALDTVGLNEPLLWAPAKVRLCEPV